MVDQRLGLGAAPLAYSRVVAVVDLFSVVFLFQLRHGDGAGVQVGVGVESEWEGAGVRLGEIVS